MHKNKEKRKTLKMINKVGIYIYTNLILRFVISHSNSDNCVLEVRISVESNAMMILLKMHSQIQGKLTFNKSDKT
jgi:hypothetical protein